MGAILIALLSFVAFFLAYITYARWVGNRIFSLDPKAKTPAHQFEDGSDFVPTRREILFGHHYTSIAGAGPIVGPAIAIIWGWLPALLWVVIGSIFIGGVHDFGSLVLSVRHKAQSIGEIAKTMVHPRVRPLLLLVIYFGLLIVLAVFVLVIGNLFQLYPQSVFPVWFEIPLALVLGYLIYKTKVNLFLASIAAVAIMYFTIWVGTLMPIKLPSLFGLPPLTIWVIILFGYAYIASTLRVWVLLQPRDYINSHELYVGLTLLFLGLVFLHPTVKAPVVNLTPKGAPPILPFIFITIACGAISGFHSLVSSGTTSKQLNSEPDAKPIGYGGMLLEGVLAVMVILAVSAGFKSTSVWTEHYASWGAASGLGAKVGAFVEGGTNFLIALHIPYKLAAGILAVMLASFAATTLDTATRIQRYIVTELATDYKIRPLATRHGATAFAVGTAAILALSRGKGAGGLMLWPLFGTVNQLLAGLALLILALYLIQRKKPTLFCLIPMVFMIGMTGWAMFLNLWGFLRTNNWTLAVLGSLVLILEAWMILEAYGQWVKLRNRRGRAEG